MKLVTVLVISGLLVCSIDGAPQQTEYDWSYSGEHGPEHWAEIGNPDCAGSSQSPVDISEDVLEYSSSLVPFQFTGYDRGDLTLDIQNNGHTVQVNVKPHGDVSVSGGDLGATYILEQFHFHWGSKDWTGSEHTYLGEHSPLEMHLVHHRSDFASVSDALEDPTGLAVLGVFFHVTNQDNPKLDSLISYLNNVMSPGSTGTLDPFPLRDLLPDHPSYYYRYHGSLTTPPCSEVVIWSVLAERVDISVGQMEEFRFLLNGEGEELVDNYRPTQPLGDRRIFVNW